MQAVSKFIISKVRPLHITPKFEELTFGIEPRTKLIDSSTQLIFSSTRLHGFMTFASICSRLGLKQSEVGCDTLFGDNTLELVSKLQALTLTPTPSPHILAL